MFREKISVLIDEDDFIDTLNEGIEKLTLHALNLSQLLLEKNHVRSLTAVLGGLILAKNRVQLFNIKFRHSSGEDKFAKSLLDLKDIIDGLTAQVKSF